jgi:type II secretory pathway pseudopilin PulG
MDMNCLRQRAARSSLRQQVGMTLVEVVLSIAISAIAIAGIISGYVCSMTSTQKWTLSLAANARAVERLEEIRSTTWKPPVDELVATNFPDEVVTLDQSGLGTGIIYGTNFTQISQISADPPLRRIRVDCVWAFSGTTLVTNTIETCRAPDQ